MNITDFFQKTYPINKEGLPFNYHCRPRIICNDGFSFSVQASEGHYCSPRYMIEEGYYEAEIGFPSIEEPLIFQYAENKNDGYTQTVYGWVPTSIIDEVIEKHGGIDEHQTFNNK